MAACTRVKAPDLLDMGKSLSSCEAAISGRIRLKVTRIKKERGTRLITCADINHLFRQADVFFFTILIVIVSPLKQEKETF
jgi:hypothetical protein